MSKRRKKKNIKYLAIAIIAIIIAIFICVGTGASNVNEAIEAISDTVSTIGKSIEGSFNNSEIKDEVHQKNVDGILELHMIDVGQGDSTLIIQGSKVCLIDCGTKSKGRDVASYLKSLGITKIDVLIGTHPHDDHMGGMAEIINLFEIGLLYTPDNSNDNITTSWYMEFLNAADEKNIDWRYAKAGERFTLGNADIQIIAPNSDNYTNKNNYSVATKITYGKTRILLTGDAEELAENEMMSLGYDLEADIFKASHHGSDTSNTKNFLNAVKPKYVLISCKTR